MKTNEILSDFDIVLSQDYSDEEPDYYFKELADNSSDTSVDDTKNKFQKLMEQKKNLPSFLTDEKPFNPTVIEEYNNDYGIPYSTTSIPVKVDTEQGKKVSAKIDELAKSNPDIKNYKDVLMYLSKEESSWGTRAQNPHGSAYGLFQMVDSTRKQYAPGISKQEFGNDMGLQILAAYRHLKDLYSRPSASKLHQMGLNDRQIARLGWFGPKYMDNYARTNGNYNWDAHTQKINGNKSLKYYIDRAS